MLRNKKIKLLSVLALSLITLTSCDTEYNRYPIDYDDPLFGEVDNVYGNKKEDYYDGLMTSDEVYSQTLNQILLDIAEVAHDYTDTKRGTSVYGVADDSSIASRNRSVADATKEDITASNASGSFDNLQNRGEESVLGNATSDSYTIDNLFYEKKFVKYLKEEFQLPSDFDDSALQTLPGKLVTPYMTYEDAFEANYDSYMENYLYDDYVLNYLTAEYIYTKTFTSIGNTNARKVQVIALTDREDEPGSARQLLDAYIADYIEGDKKDEDFSILSRLWKGITADDIAALIDESAYGNDTAAYNAAVAEMQARYASVILTDEEEQWLAEHGIISTDVGSNTSIQNTLAGEVYADQLELERNAENSYTVDTALESEYTGSYTYDYRTGLRMAYDNIAKLDFVTDGIQLSSDGLSALPGDLKDRIFSNDFTTDLDEIEEMREAGKNNDNPGIDITTYKKDGYRYLTYPGTAQDDPGILYYDISSRTYYIVRILDVVTNTAMGRYGAPNSSSVYNDVVKQEQIAREVAYAMATTSTYKTDATVYWLRRTEIDYSDEDFLEYMKTNYQDLFRTEASTDGDATIVLESQDSDEE